MGGTSDGGPISARLRWARRLAGALVMGVGLALLAFVLFNLVQDASLLYPSLPAPTCH